MFSQKKKKKEFNQRSYQLEYTAIGTPPPNNVYALQLVLGSFVTAFYYMLKAYTKEETKHIWCMFCTLHLTALALESL
jgi:uncharacterized protein YvpB